MKQEKERKKRINVRCVELTDEQIMFLKVMEERHNLNPSTCMRTGLFLLMKKEGLG